MPAETIGLCPATGGHCSTIEWIENCLSDDMGMSNWQRRSICSELCERGCGSIEDSDYEE